MLLQACLGLSFNGLEYHVLLNGPSLPDSINDLRIHNLEVNGGLVDLLMVRHEHDVGVTVMRREGAVRVTVAK
jgi:hypothetical protein